jgi:toxin-antitoxin system PIN domain toxin
VIAVDTNVLIYAHRRDSGWYQPAADRVRELAEHGAPWAIPWQCVHEFLAAATHPGIFDPPSSPAEAVRQIELWFESPALVLLSEGSGHWRLLRELVARGQVRGARVHDARVAAVCLANGVTELWTADRDFGRFPELRVRNPLVSS